MVVHNRGVSGAPGVWSRSAGESLDGSIQHTFIEYPHVKGIDGGMEDTGGWQIASYLRDSSCGNQCCKEEICFGESEKALRRSNL